VEAWIAAVREEVGTGMSRRDAIADVARRAGVPRRRVYDAVVKAGSERT
jgi:16S rRNA (cytidine1402-2'-O)-methyltransferase